MVFAILINMKRNLTGIFQDYLQGQHVFVSGTFTQDATDGGGVIVTGLSSVKSWNAIGNVDAKPPFENSISGGSITVGFNPTAGPTAGTWWAEGVL